MCKLAANCKNTAEYVVTHKSVGKRQSRDVEACGKCAGRIGALTGKPLISNGGENRFYKISRI